MYSSFPKKDQRRIRVSLSVAWFFSALSGVGGVVLTPTTLQDEVGSHLPVISSLAVLVFSAAACIGVALNKYQVEWVAAYFAAAGSITYIMVVWYLVLFGGNPTRLQQAAYLTSLLSFYVYRIVSCSAHASKQRRIHELRLKEEERLNNASS